ncbi:hypothetical protein NQZ68_017300 [Dissostichus eleginoides]|nr:hypothetical protein NQZ68_017300 [Dissostichus eleginoides]
MKRALLLLLLLFGPLNKTREQHFPQPLDALNSREAEQRCVSVAKSQSRALPLVMDSRRTNHRPPGWNVRQRRANQEKWAGSGV